MNVVHKQVYTQCICGIKILLEGQLGKECLTRLIRRVIMNRKVEMLVKGNGCSADDLWVFPRRGEWWSG